MSTLLSHEAHFDDLKSRISKAVQEYFPVEGSKSTLRAKKVWVDDTKKVTDIHDQKEAKLAGRTWSVPVRAELELVDNKTGKVKDRQVVNVGNLPKLTQRLSYIVNGTEKQVTNQFRLKSGVYTRVKNNGDLEGRWNLARGAGFSMNFDPEKRKMSIKYPDGSNVPLYPVLKLLGVDDDAIERRWGREILSANMTDKPEVAIRKLYKTLSGKTTTSIPEAKRYILESFDRTALRSDTTKQTLGTAYNKVDGSALLSGSDKILKVFRQEDKPDDRDNLQFKEIWDTGDLVTERLKKDARRDINRKLKGSVDRGGRIRTMVSPDLFGRHIEGFFSSSNGLSNRPEQFNPMNFLIGFRKTTIGGEHGIDDPKKITLEAKSINPSHMGYLDAVQTPEAERIGSILQMSLGTRKKGKELEARVYNNKTGKYQWVDAKTAFSSNVAFPDQYTWEHGTPRPVDKSVKVADKEGNIAMADPVDVDYILPTSRGMFDFAANMIPFLQSDQGNRTMVAAKQIEQAVALKNREEPLVQTKARTGTFEKIVGDFSSHTSPVSGTVMGVTKNKIVVRDKAGNRHEVQLYRDFPLNDNRSVMNSLPLVSAGDTVKSGQLLADSNFTRGGTLALGTSLRAAYTPYKGYNFEDGTVISESAAKKLISEHMYRDGVEVGENTILDKKKFFAHTAGKYTKEQASKLDDDGVIRVGEKVGPGDVLIGELRKEKVTREQEELGLFNKKWLKPVKPFARTWEKETPGVVSQVVKHGKNVTVYVKTEEPADIGDKVVGRHGNKAIISQIIPDHEMPRTNDGKHAEILMNPSGLPSRINLGQALETAAAKIAEKTGKPYVVTNFDPKNKNYIGNLRKELKSHGISDTEDMFDPQTGKKLGKVLVGPQYVYKLHHTVSKKLQARSRGAYTQNMAPKGGGPSSGQTLDTMGLYALLAHGAKENIRELQSYKADRNDQWWEALQSGEPIPPPKVPFVYKKFEDLLRGMGVDVQKDGNSLFLSPLTDKQVLEMSEGELKRPSLGLTGKDAKPEKGGIFDKDVTGTTWPAGEMGKNWSHITLASAMPNPLFEKPITSLLGISGKDMVSVIRGDLAYKGKKGPEAIVDALSNINVETELTDKERQLPSAKTTKLNKLNRQVKYLRALKKAGMDAKEAYTMKHLPVVPPVMRPISILDNGDINTDDLNQLYRGIGMSNEKLEEADPRMPGEEYSDLRESLYEGLKALTLTGKTFRRRHLSGIAARIAGSDVGSPKRGFFQNKIIGRRQDMSMRGTIVPEPSLGLDEVAIPKKAAVEVYKPFTSRRLVRAGYKPLEADYEIKTNSPVARAALEREVQERPLLMKRDPVLHKYGVQAFKPVLTSGKAIKIHPLVTDGFNADFDGNCVIGSSKIALKFGDRDAMLSSGILEEDGMKIPGDVKILLERFGSVEIRIEDIPRTSEPLTEDKNGNPVYGVPAGMEVYSYDHESNKALFAKVSGVTIEENCPVVLVKTSRLEVTVSDNESLCSYNHTTGEVEKISPRGSEGRLVPVVAKYDMGGSLYDFEVGWMIGAFASDGFFMGDNFSVIGYSKVSDAHRDRFFRAVRNMESGKIRRATYGTTHGPEDAIEGRSVKDHIYGLNDCVDLFLGCYDDGVRNKDKDERASLYKKLPENLADFSEEALYGVLSGLLDGDGHVSWSYAKKKPQLIAQVQTSSPYLKESVAHLGRLLGIRTSATPTHPKKGRVQKHVAYVINISSTDLQKVADKLDLINSEPLEKLSSQDRLKDDRDIVPVPTNIINLLASKKGPCTPRNQRTIATVKSGRRRGHYVVRSLAKELLGVIPTDTAGYDKWRSLVLAEDIRWEAIISVDDAGTETVYDLVVPRTKVFAVNNGLVIWDTMSAYVPVSEDAKIESRKMFPSHNLFSPSTGALMFLPKQESMLGLFKLTEMGKQTKHRFKNANEAARAVKDGKIDLTDVIELDTLGPLTEKVAAVKRTTVGRLYVNDALPKELRSDKVLSDPKFVMDKSNIKAVLTETARNHRGQFSDTANKLKDYGNYHATGMSFGLEDLEPDTKVRDEEMRKAKAVERRLWKSEKISPDERDKLLTQLYVGVLNKVNEVGKKNADAKKGRMYDWIRSGARGSWDQYRQMTIAPILVMDSNNKPVPVPIDKSYAEGLDIGSYWTSMHGARMGMIGRVLGTEVPGTLLKQMMGVSIDQVVDAEDCGTKKGIALSIEDRDALGRYTYKDVNLGNRAGKDKGTIPAGTLVTPELLGRLKNNKIREVPVRTTLKCNHGTGVCSRCSGVDEDGQDMKLGTNVGVLSAHAMGEPLTQLSMDSFHQGGVVGAWGTSNVNRIQRINQLTELPKTLPGSSTLASSAGKVQKVEDDPTGGKNVYINNIRHFVKPQSTLLVKRGQEVRKGDAITDGPKNPHELLDLTNMNSVQRYLTDELYSLYAGVSPIKRRNVETFVRGMTNLSHVDDPGSHGIYLRGDYAPTSAIEAYNRVLKGGKAPVVKRPVLKGASVLSRDLHEDWLARMQASHLRDTLIDASAEGWKSFLHGTNPVPGMAYAAEFGKGTPDKPWRY